MRVKKSGRERERGRPQTVQKCAVLRGFVVWPRALQHVEVNNTHTPPLKLVEIISVFQFKPKKSLVRLIRVGQFVCKTITSVNKIKLDKKM